MKHDLKLPDALRNISEDPIEKPEKMAGCGGRCHAYGCSQDCCMEPYHDGPHRCYDHR